MTRHLTDRQRQVLRLRALGWTNKEVANELGVSTQTVKYHTAIVYERLGGVENLNECLIKLGWLTIPEMVA